jgi:mannose-6-phosphate isomerase
MKLRPVAVDKPWGRDRLRDSFGALQADGGRTGEIWFEEPEGRTLPLLVKYIFTSEKLSVQVHPDDAQARARGLPNGKSECWYILAAEPEAALALGFRESLGEGELRAAALDGSIEALLDWKPVSPGDFFYVPAGTVHAIGAGVSLIEVQQPSDTTYRLYDYGRPRELHLDEGVAVADPRPWTPLPIPGEVAQGRSILVEGPKFVLERWSAGARSVAVPDGSSAWLVPIAGAGTVDATPFAAGECLTVTGQARVVAEAGSDLLFAYPGSRRIDMAAA